MKKLVVPIGRMIVVLLLLAGLSVCTMSDQAAGAPPEDALSFEQLLEGLDGLQGTATQSPSAPGMSVFSLPNGSLFSSADLSAYLNAIKRDLAAYIYACTGGRPYLVRPVALHWDADPSSVERRESGLMWVPVTWWGRPVSTPVISFQHGTQVFRGCAPSLFNANPLSVLASPDLTGALQNYVECVVGALMATAGYTVVMPDYPGFGDSTVRHPYVNLVLGDSVVGALGAARAVLATRGVTPGAGLYLTGYSEGGYATMAGALALQAQEVTVTKTVPCDGAYSLSGVMLGEMLDQEPELVPSYLLYTAAGYQSVYGFEDIDYFEFLKTDYAAGLIAVDPFDGNHTNAFVSGLGLPSVAREMILGDWPDVPEVLQSGGSVYDCLAENNAWQGWGSAPPPVFVHCPLDDVVPFQNAVEAQAELGGSIHQVAPVPFVKLLLGSYHVAAFPTAMLEAFRIIREP